MLVAGFVKKNSKVILSFILFFLWIIMSFTYNCADETVYLSRYNHLELWAGETEILYYALIYFANAIGLSYMQFHALICLLQIALIASTVNKLARYPNLVYVLYFICPFMLNVIQQRHALATSIFIFAVKYLVDIENEKKLNIGVMMINTSDIKYILCIIIATFIHTESILWLILLIAKRYSLKVNISVMIIFNILIMYVLTPENIAIVLHKFGAANRMSAYLSMEYQMGTWRLYGQLVWIIYVAVIVILTALYLYLRNKNAELSSNIIFILKLNIIVLSIIGLLIRYTGEVYRIQESMAILNYILLSNFLSFNTSKRGVVKRKDIIIMLMLLLYAFGTQYMMILRYNIETIWNPIFNNNYFFDLFLK